MSVVYPSLLFDAQGPHSSNLYTYPIPAMGDTTFVTQQIHGASTFHGQVSEIPFAKYGDLWNGVNWTLYNHILIFPPLIVLGNLLTNQTRTIQVWNSFGVPKTISDFTTLNDDGITVTEPVTIPYVLKPLELITYVVEISTDGPATINATYTWTVDGADYIANIVGKRAFIFPFPPNYRDEITESLEWKSDIIRSRSGHEQRRAIRTKPRRQFEYSYTLGKEDNQRLQNILWGWQNRVFALPVWTDKLITTSPINIGDIVINLDTTNFSYKAGDSLILYKDADDFEVAEILSIGSTITLVRAVTKNWPTNSKVFPIIEAHMPVSSPVKRLTGSVTEGVATFITDPSVVDPYIPTGGSFVSYDGLEIITIQPNWINDLDNTFEFPFDTLDYESGSVQWQSSEDYSFNTRRYSWLLKNRQAIKEFRQFLGRRRGMVKTFWVPTWTEDFTVVQTVGAGDSSIVVQDNGYADLIKANPAHNRIMIRLTNGITYYRKINDAIIGPGNKQITLTLDNSLGVSYTVDKFIAIHMIDRCRLATDKVSLQWKTNSTVVIETTFTTVIE